MNSQKIKDIVISTGADLCGIASVDRFDLAPKGFHPRDLFPECRSVIVFACALTDELLKSPQNVPYTRFMEIAMLELDRIAFGISRELRKNGIGALPIPADDPYEYWEPDRLHGRGILSLRHAGWLAGLGGLGRNTLLINKTYGNRINLGAVLSDAELQADPVVREPFCPANCRICLDRCPGGALDGKTVDQAKCRRYATIRTEKGYELYSCLTCRRLCPFGGRYEKGSRREHD